MPGRPREVHVDQKFCQRHHLPLMKQLFYQRAFTLCSRRGELEDWRTHSREGYSRTIRFLACFLPPGSIDPISLYSSRICSSCNHTSSCVRPRRFAICPPSITFTKSWRIHPGRYEDCFHPESIRAPGIGSRLGGSPQGSGARIHNGLSILQQKRGERVALMPHAA